MCEPITSPDDPRVVAFLKAWHENGRAVFARRYPNLAARGSYDAPNGEAKSAKAGKKYINLDRGSSGVLMVERETGQVYGIKAYGRIHRGHPKGHIDDLTANLEAATAEGRECEVTA